MGRAKDLTGQKFNSLTVIEKLEERTKNGSIQWKCQCDCGNYSKLTSNAVSKGHIKSCGCTRDSKPRISFEEFSNEYSNGYELSCDNWIGIVGSIVKVKCSIHGESERNSDSVRQTEIPCVQCANEKRNKTKTRTYEEIVEKCIEIFDGKYSYPISNKDSYVNQKSVITVKCEKHGEFSKRVQKHLGGQGCEKCMYESLVEDEILIGGYNLTILGRNPEIANSTGFLYYLKIGEYYKVGITRTSVKDRAKALKSKSKLNVEILDVKEMSLIDAFILEQLILKSLKDERTRTDWSTELFSYNILNGTLPDL